MRRSPSCPFMLLIESFSLPVASASPCNPWTPDASIDAFARPRMTPTRFPTDWPA